MGVINLSSRAQALFLAAAITFTALVPTACTSSNAAELEGDPSHEVYPGADETSARIIAELKNLNGHERMQHYKNNFGSGIAAHPERLFMSDPGWFIAELRTLGLVDQAEMFSTIRVALVETYPSYALFDTNPEEFVSELLTLGLYEEARTYSLIVHALSHDFADTTENNLSYPERVVDPGGFMYQLSILDRRRDAEKFAREYMNRLSENPEIARAITDPGFFMQNMYFFVDLYGFPEEFARVYIEQLEAHPGRAALANDPNLLISTLEHANLSELRQRFGRSFVAQIEAHPELAGTIVKPGVFIHHLETSDLDDKARILESILASQPALDPHQLALNGRTNTTAPPLALG